MPRNTLPKILLNAPTRDSTLPESLFEKYCRSPWYFCYTDGFRENMRFLLALEYHVHAAKQDPFDDSFTSNADNRELQPTDTC